jgi:hypothetical protein
MNILIRRVLGLVASPASDLRGKYCSSIRT